MPSLLENLSSTDPNLTITRESLTFSQKPDNFSDISHAITRHDIWLTFYTISARGEESLGYSFLSYGVRADIRGRLNLAGEFTIIDELKNFGLISTEIWAEKACQTTEYYYDYINDSASELFKLNNQDFMVSLKKIVDNQAKQADFDRVKSIIPTFSDPTSPNVQEPRFARELEFLSTPVGAAEAGYQNIERKQQLIEEKIQWQSLFKDIGKTEKGQALENQVE